MVLLGARRSHLSPRRLPGLVPGLVLALGLTVALPLGAPTVPLGPTATSDVRPVAADRDVRPQTSDGVIGPAPGTRDGRPSAGGADEPGDPDEVKIRQSQTFRIVPGLVFKRWFRTDARGQNRIQLLTANLDQPGLTFDTLAGSRVTSTATVKDLVTRDGAVAGVNGDFYDIRDTQASLGITRDRERSVLNAAVDPNLYSFFTDGTDAPDIGKVPVRAYVRGHPELQVAGVNTPHIGQNQVGVYTAKWGELVGSSVTDGYRGRVRMVVVADGKVTHNTRRLTRGTVVKGTILIGKGNTAEADLAKLRVGSTVQPTWGLTGAPRMVLSGDPELLRDGRIREWDDSQEHPRTIVGIDRDDDQLLVMVVDGRQDTSRGVTFVEAARLIREAGAEDAINLDGGGSSTMVGRKPGGGITTLNSPSDGFARRVNNGLGFFWDSAAARRG